MRRVIAGAALILCMLSFGCYQRQEFSTLKVLPGDVQRQFGDKPADLLPYYEQLLAEGARNTVLNNMRLGVRAMELRYWEEAEAAFDNALAQIEAVYANNETAAKARNLYYEEGMKDFKGEPYERCMAYYYRSLLYFRKGDFDNARACCRAGILQDAFAEEDQNRCDFAMLIFLDAWMAQKLGDMDSARALYAEVKRYRPDFKEPDPNDNVLILAETGMSPRKVADGVGHAELKFRRGRNFNEKCAVAALNGGEPVKLFPMEDVAWQAMSRGGRAVDKILKGKVLYRQTNEQIGTVLTDISSNAMTSAPLWADNAGTVQGVSAAVGIVGVIHLAAAASARPHADTRYWDNLPDGVHVATVSVQPGNVHIRMDFGDGEGVVFEELSKQEDIVVTDDKAGFIWLRSRQGSS